MCMNLESILPKTVGIYQTLKQSCTVQTHHAPGQLLCVKGQLPSVTLWVVQLRCGHGSTLTP